VDEQLVLFRHATGVAHLRLNRPAARNALSVALCDALIEAMSRVAELYQRGEVRVAVLSGAGYAFCAGADLKERGTMDTGAMSAHSALIGRCADALATLACPVIACVHGAALGGGLELALACDLRVVASDAVLGFPEVSYGFFPGAGGPVRLARLVGISTATYLLMTGRRISGCEAVELAIAHEAVLTERLEETVARHATTLAGYPPAGIKALRELMASLDEKRTRGGMRRARALRDALNADPAIKQAIKAFDRHAQ
jgi:enoyl-CoA hydratase/carnithine racemase